MGVRCQRDTSALAAETAAMQTVHELREQAERCVRIAATVNAADAAVLIQMARESLAGREQATQCGREGLTTSREGRHVGIVDDCAENLPWGRRHRGRVAHRKGLLGTIGAR